MRPPAPRFQPTLLPAWTPALHRPSPAAVLIAAVITAAGCAALPARFDDRAIAVGLVPDQLAAGDFMLRTYRSRAARPGERLHVYLDGDGRPWRADPTTARRVVLEMMEVDPGPALLIGRPCYYGTVAQAACRPALWTSQRYGGVVVDTMTAALLEVAENTQGSAITLIGYSGGGALATLIAPRVPAVDTVVTVAANLDIDAWTRHHGEADLDASLNPAEQAPLPIAIRQLHVAGGRDRNVPAALNARYLDRQAEAEQWILAEEDHGCCWGRVWPQVLARLASPTGS